jgi:hypothetical protein
MTRSCTNTLFILFIFPSADYVRIDKTSLALCEGGFARSVPIKRRIGGGSRFRQTGRICKGVSLAGETVAIPTGTICLHMDQDNGPIEGDPRRCPAVPVAQAFLGLHTSMCIAQGHVQPVAKPQYEETSLFWRFSSHYAGATCCDRGYGRPSGRRRVSNLATY